MTFVKLAGIVFMAGLLVVGSVDFSMAAEESIDELKKEIQVLKERLAQLEKKVDLESRELAKGKTELAAQEEKIKEVKNEFEYSSEYLLLGADQRPTFSWNGLRIGLQGTFIGQGTDNANLLGPSKKDKFEGSCQLDLEMEKKFSDINGRAYTNIRAGEGAGADRVLVLYSGADNNKADDKHLWFTALFYEQFLFNKRFVVDLGKIDNTVFFDLNRLAGSDATQFLASIFNNNPVIEFPNQNLAVRLGFLPVDLVEISLMTQNANDNWNDIDNSLFNIGQMTLKPHFFDREGYYRFMAWYNNVPHLKWSDGSTRGTYGFALSFDQDISEIISLFARYGWEDPKVYNPNITVTGNYILSLEQSWSAGMQFTGKLWGRESDCLGIAVGQVMPSNDYRKALARKGKDEGHLELYYIAQLNNHISLGPGFQYIWNPYGEDVSDNTDDVFVYY